MLELPHETLEEDLLHSIFISQMKDAGRCMEELERFLPHVDNWSVCDSLRPKALYKEPELLLRGIERWIASPHLYTCRFAMEMLMMRFLEEIGRAHV